MTLTKESEALLESAAYVCNELDWKCVPLAGLADRLAAIEAAVRAEQAAPANHPDDGHDHHFTCIRCGVNPPEQAADVERLRAALDRAREMVSSWLYDWQVDLPDGAWGDFPALAATPVAPAPNSAPNPPAPHRCRECDDGPNLSFPEPTHAPPAPGER